jgi:hypothetical protein
MVYAQVRERYFYDPDKAKNHLYMFRFDDDDFDWSSENVVLIPSKDPNKIPFYDPNGNPTVDPNLYYDPNVDTLYVINIDVNGLTIPDLTASRLAATDVNKTLVSVTDFTNWIAGTSNQITVTDDTDGTLTLSTPQDIHTGASPTFTDLTLSGYLDIEEIVEPSTPAADTLRLYVEDIQGYSFFKYLDSGGMKREVLRDSMILVYNNTGSQILANRVVYASGSFNNFPTVALAKSNSTSTMPAIGVTIENINDTSYGRVMQVGLLENIDTSALSVGDILYVHDTIAGLVRITPPVTPALTQEVGTVLVDNASTGAIQIIARGQSGDEYGTAQNDFYIGDGTAGSKALHFNAVTDASIIWDETKFDLTASPLQTTGVITAGGLTATNTIDEFSTDGTLADNSDSAVPTEKAVKTYVDAAAGSLTQEEVEDYVGGMLDGTETFISVTYQDAAGNIDFVVPVKNEDNMTSDSDTHLATQQSIKAYVDAQSGSGEFSPLILAELSADPDKPTEGKAKIWMSDGTGTGDDGDVIIAATAGGTTKRAILWDFSAASEWIDFLLLEGGDILLLEGGDKLILE